jgi:hypothetical protein
VAKQLLDEGGDGNFPVLPENWPVVELFLAVQTQWRMAPMGGVLGLDYSAVDVAIRRGGHADDAETFAGLQVMERAAVAEIQAQQERNKG